MQSDYRKKKNTIVKDWIKTERKKNGLDQRIKTKLKRK